MIARPPIPPRMAFTPRNDNERAYLDSLNRGEHRHEWSHSRVVVGGLTCKCAAMVGEMELVSGAFKARMGTL